MRRLAEEFPDQEDWLLPTPFGNIIRAFEVYPRVMYGIESIQGWNRLITVLPEECRELVDNAKAQVDFWINICLLSSLFVVEYLVIAFAANHIRVFWLVILAMVAISISQPRSESAAIGWGEYVKSSFDVFLPELRKKLGYSQPINKEQERIFWTQFSQAIGYRLPDVMQNDTTEERAIADLEEEKEEERN
jgi:hypothetical protein